MAVPTIAALSPSTGPAAGGQLVTITGANFKVPVLVHDIPTPSTITPTVAVTFNGRAARRIDVISATEVRVLTPRYYRVDPRADAFSAVTVVLSNLDASGVTIPGEVVTKASAYTYKRWEVGAPRPEPPVTRVVKELMWALAIEVERHTYRATHVDYGEEGSAVVISKAQLPSVNISLTVMPDYEHGCADMYPYEVDKGDGSFDLYEGMRTVQVALDVLIAGETANEAEGLAQSLQDFVQVHPLLDCPADPTLFPNDTDEYPIEITQFPVQVGGVGAAGMVVMQMGLRILGIRTLPDDPTENVLPWTTATLSSQHMDTDGSGDGAIAHVDLIP